MKLSPKINVSICCEKNYIYKCTHILQTFNKYKNIVLINCVYCLIIIIFTSFVVQTRLLVTTHSIQCYMYTFYRPNICCWQTAKNERNMNKWTMDIICTMESFGLYEAVVNILSYFNIRVNNKKKVVLVVKLRQGSGKGQARIDKGWQLRRKASKLKPLPRAYIKVGCHLPTTTTHPPISLILLN